VTSEGPVLVAVSVDPERSHRAGEAVRIALGILAGETEVVIALLGAGARVLDRNAEDHVDGEETLRHLGTLKRLGQRFHVERAAIGADRGWNPLGVEVIPIDRADLARLLGRSRRALLF
jgi:hypothetical protein